MASMVLTVLSVIGSVLNARKMIACLYVWTVCNVGWGVVDFASGNYPRTFLDAFQLVVGLYGIWHWRKK